MNSNQNFRTYNGFAYVCSVITLAELNNRAWLPTSVDELSPFMTSDDMKKSVTVFNKVHLQKNLILEWKVVTLAKSCVQRQSCLFPYKPIDKSRDPLIIEA
jgi:hypothetical protein